MTHIVRLLLMMVALLVAAANVWAGIQSPFELDVKDLDRAPAPVKPTKNPTDAKTSRAADKKHKSPKKPLVASTGYTRYTIKNGDHIFKILMKNFGMSNAAAEALIPEILRLNGITDFKRLTVGQSILIPTKSGARNHEQQAATVQNAPTVKASATESPVSIAVRSVTARNTEETLDAILNIIPVKWNKDRTLETAGGARSVPRFSVKVDRYLEYGGQRFIVSLGKTDPFTFTLYRLLEMDGYKLIRLDAGQNFSDTVSTVLTALKISYRYGDHLVVLNDKNHTATSIKGFLFTKDTVPPRLVLVSEKAVAALTAELKWDQERPVLN